MSVWLFPAPVEMTSELSKELKSEDLSEVSMGCDVNGMCDVCCTMVPPKATLGPIFHVHRRPYVGVVLTVAVLRPLPVLLLLLLVFLMLLVILYLYALTASTVVVISITAACPCAGVCTACLVQPALLPLLPLSLPHCCLRCALALLLLQGRLLLCVPIQASFSSCPLLIARRAFVSSRLSRRRSPSLPPPFPAGISCNTTQGFVSQLAAFRSALSTQLSTPTVFGPANPVTGHSLGSLVPALVRFRRRV